MAKRGHRQYILDALPDRPVTGAGQGGGGALRKDELKHFLFQWRLVLWL